MANADNKSEGAVFWCSLWERERIVPFLPPQSPMISIEGTPLEGSIGGS
jgi:hypothetical protein